MMLFHFNLCLPSLCNRMHAFTWFAQIPFRNGVSTCECIVHLMKWIKFSLAVQNEHLLKSFSSAFIFVQNSFKDNSVDNLILIKYTTNKTKPEKQPSEKFERFWWKCYTKNTTKNYEQLITTYTKVWTTVAWLKSHVAIANRRLATVSGLNAKKVRRGRERERVRYDVWRNYMNIWENYS